MIQTVRPWTLPQAGLYPGSMAIQSLFSDPVVKVIQGGVVLGTGRM